MSTHYKPLNDGPEKPDKKPMAKQKPPAVFSQVKFMEKRRLKQLDWTELVPKKRKKLIIIPYQVTYVWKGEGWNIYDIMKNATREVKYKQWSKYEMLRANKSKTKEANME